MRLSKILVFLALIGVVQESAQNRCHLEKESIQSFSSRGDIVLGVITLIHSTIDQTYETFNEKPEAATCEDFLIRYYRDVLAVVFAIEEINENFHLLPNFTLGFNIFDSCVSEARALQATLKLLWPESSYESSPRWKDPFLAGIVGDSMSTLSIPIARILGPCHYPQISFGAFDPDLGDRHQFPTFLRTVPNENIQNKAISQLLKHLGWTWVGILTRDDDLGALDGQNLKEEISRNQGCVAFLEKIHFRYSIERIRKIYDIVMNSTAIAVVVYSEEMHMKPLLDMMAEAGTKGKIWIYTLSFTFIPGMFSEGTSKLLNGSIGLVLHSEPLPQFDGYLRNIHPSKDPEDIYIKEFWKVAFNCTWSSNAPPANDTGDVVTCRGDEDLEDKVESLFELADLSYTFQAYIAVYAFAYALHNLLYCVSPAQESATTCGEEALLPWQADSLEIYDCVATFSEDLNTWSLYTDSWKYGGHDVTTGIYFFQVYRYLMGVSFTTRSGEEIFFNDIGEVPATFDIMNLLILSNNEYRLVKVGRYDSRAATSEQISLDIGTVVWNQEYKEVPHSVCSESCKPGNRKVSVQGLPICCFQCVPCSLGEITNETDAAVCMKCPEDMWPNEKRDICLMKVVQFLSYEEIMGVSLSATSITFSIKTLTILCIFRKFSETPVVKANNRSLSYVILVGLIVCFLSSLIFIGYPSGVICLLRQVVFGVSFSVVVSGMLAKTITVILIFQSTKSNAIGKRFDSKISHVVMFICPLFQVGICIVWLGTVPPYAELNMTSKPDAIIAQCNEGSNLFFYCMLGYMGLLATVSFIVAFLSRKLPDSFNEGQYITFSMFVFLSVWICFIPAYLSAEGKDLVTVEVFAIMASSAGLLGCLFFPKCYIILFRPEMNTKQYVRGKQ
ncbi:vomeronasal type-2 receptor 26-like [Ranitomeya variabilis]|uniref:vomeronasal type-2 receptor 26-like n=1 Tax=Ranitomeya variabilis TaxID=490064 RepID=UPI0040560E2E